MVKGPGEGPGTGNTKSGNLQRIRGFHFKGLALSPGSGSGLRLVTSKLQFPSVKWEEGGYNCLARSLGLDRTPCIKHSVRSRD